MLPIVSASTQEAPPRSASSKKAGSASGGSEKKKSSASTVVQQENLRSPYEILEISVSASTEEIRIAYRKMASMYHPDKVAHLAAEFREMAERKMKEINIANEALKSTK